MSNNKIKLLGVVLTIIIFGTILMILIEPFIFKTAYGLGTVGVVVVILFCVFIFCRIYEFVNSFIKDKANTNNPE